jgi:hypothetical protein
MIKNLKDLQDMGFELDGRYFIQITKGDRKGMFDVNKAFAMYALKVLKLKPIAKITTIVALTNGGAIVGAETSLVNENEHVVIRTIATSSNSAKSKSRDGHELDTTEFASNGQKAMTAATKNAIDWYLGLDETTIQLIAKELNLKSSIKPTKTWAGNEPAIASAEDAPEMTTELDSGENLGIEL